MRILRVALEVTEYQTIALPVGSKILHVAPCRSGRERIDLWYWERPAGDDRRVDTGIYVVGTGATMPKALSQFGFHIGTCVMASYLVWHVFEGPVQR
jgi:hypothetical protein